ATMDVDHDRRFDTRGPIDIELLDLARSIGESKRRFQPLPRRFTREPTAFGDVLLIRCVDALVIRVIEFLLIHIEPDKRPLDLLLSCWSRGVFVSHAQLPSQFKMVLEEI